jgi:type II secretory pathway pseudopilin PulG
MPTPAPKGPPREEGFIIIEVLVSAIILALVAGAVLTLITATTRSAASQRTRATAYGLAQETQAKLRTMRISELKSLNRSRPETVSGTTYTIEERGAFVNNSSETSSCGESNSAPSYIKITSTVSANGLANPVSLQSIVSPTSGSLDANLGNLALQASNAREEPLSEVPISLTGKANYNGSTDSAGCANFNQIPSGNYSVTATNSAGLITPEGKTSWVKESGVPAGGTQELTFHFDKPGTLKPEFVYLEPGTGTPRPAPMDAMQIYNPESGAAASTVGTPGGTRTATVTATGLYPFKTKYAVYAGSCTGNNPNPENKEPANQVGVGALELTPGGVATGQVRVPALELNVTNNGGVVVGAKVVVTDSTCGSSAKRTYITNAGGHLAKTSGGATEAGLPFGTYKVCASATISGAIRRAEVSNVEVKNLAAGTILNLPLGSGSSECS